MTKITNSVGFEGNSVAKTLCDIEKIWVANYNGNGKVANAATLKRIIGSYPNQNIFFAIINE